MGRRILSLALIVGLVLAGFRLGYLAYRRIGTPPQLVRGVVAVDGVISEKLIVQQRLSPLPINLPAYTVRYAFPVQGQMRTGQQIVTRRTFERLGGQGAPAQVYLSADDPTITAVDARIAFPSVSGVRLIAGIGCLVGAYLVLMLGQISGGREGAATLRPYE